MKVTLSPRQTQILDLLVQGHKQHAIAEILSLNHKTVHSHIRFAAVKFGIEQLGRVHTEELIRCAKAYFDFVRSPTSQPGSLENQ
jgi:DNA-binding NarL/FixJ family response regulator